MMKKILCFIIILTTLLFTLTGCYDANGIESFYYIVALGVDKSENNLISLSVQIAKPSSTTESSSAQSNEYKIYTVDCETIESGINILNNYLNKTINISHCSAIIFSEEVAKEGLLTHINVLGNNAAMRPSCNIIISSQKAIDVLNKVSNSGSNFSSRLYENIVNSVEYTGYTIDSTFSSFLSNINNDQTQATAIYTIVTEDSVQNSGLAVFKDDKMVGTLSPFHTIAHLIIEDDLESCIITIDNPMNKKAKIDLNLQKLKSSDIDIELINGTPIIEINLFVQATIASSGEEFDYTSISNINAVEKATNEYLEKITKEYLYLISKDYNSDIVGFYGYLASKYLTTDQFDKVHWNEIFKDSYFNVNISTRVNSSHLFNRE